MTQDRLSVTEPYFIQFRSTETRRGRWHTVTVGYDLDCSWEMAALLEEGVEPRLGDVVDARAVGSRELTPEEARAARRELGLSTHADLELAAALRRNAQLRLATAGGSSRQRRRSRPVNLQELWARLLVRPPSRRAPAGAVPAPAPPPLPRRADRRAHLH